jgi:type I restriction enzyme, S subunit
MELVADKYKQTEVGLIPSDWEVKTISQISNPVRGGSPRPAGDPRYFNGNYIPWLTVAALTNIPLSQLYVSETETYLTEQGSLHSRILEKETLIIANSGATLGVTKILAIKCCANDGIAALLDFDKGTNKQYLVYFINTQIKYLREVVATGNGQRNLNTGLIGNIKVPLPPTIEEQTAIATALSDADALISSLEKLIAKKRNIKQGAMQQLLQPKEGWEVKKLGEISAISKGKGISKSQLADSGNFECILYGELFTTYNEVISSIVSKTNYSESVASKYGDIIYPGSTTTTGIDLAKASTILKDNVLLGGDIVILRKSSYEYNPIFLSYFLNEVRRNDIAQTTKGITIHHLYGKDLAGIYAAFPPMEEQNKIANILTDMDAEIAALETKLEKYKKVKLGMMQNLLTGKIRLI